MGLWSWLTCAFRKKTMPPVGVAPPPVDETPWLTLMLSWQGQDETTGKPMDDFEKMVFSHTHCPTPGNIELSGCAATMSACLDLSGMASKESAAASDYLAYGLPLPEFKPGCLVVWPHHVTLGVSMNNDGTIECCGGNQGHRVCTARFPVVFEGSRPLYRWPVPKTA